MLRHCLAIKERNQGGNLKMTELPDHPWKLYPEVDYDIQEEIDPDEKAEAEFDRYLDYKDEINMDRLR